MKMLFFIMFYAGLAFNVHAGELNGVQLDDAVKVQDKKLQLNGMGLRVVHKFGIPIKVYVAGLYLETKSSDSDIILQNDEIKQLVMQFVRPVERDSLNDAFRSGYESACFLQCESKNAQYAEFAKTVVSVRKDNRIILTFYKDKLEIETTGPNANKKEIKDASLSRNLLSVFINKKSPPSTEFRSGLLGIK